METTRQIVCIICPRGCKIDVNMKDGETKSIVGYSCKRGETYAHTECTAPTRTLTTTMHVTGGSLPIIPVRSQTPVPKGMMFDFMKAINSVGVEAPVNIGDVVLENVLGMGINIIATRNMPRAS